MILTLLCVFIVFLGLVFLGIYRIHHKGNHGYSDQELIHRFLLVIGGMLLAICLFAIVMRESCAGAHVKEFEAVQSTMDGARLNEKISPLELAAIQQKAVEKNEELASMKFWATHPLSNWFYSKKILAIKPIE